MVKKIFSGVLGAIYLALTFAFVPATSPAAATVDTTNGAVVDVTFPGASGLTGTLTDFPVAVRFGDDSPQGFSYETCTNPKGICFYSDVNCTVELPCEIEWNPQGESVAWVKIPQFTKNTKVYMVWKNHDGVIERTTQPKDVWSDYLGVWHMNDEPGTVIADSALSVANMNGSTTAPIVFDPFNGKIGGATKTSSASETITVRDFAADIANKKFSVSGWFYWPGATTTDYQVPFSKGDWNSGNGSYIEIYQGYTKIHIVLPQSSGNYYDVLKDVRYNWNHFAFVCDGSNTRLYINGTTSNNLVYNVSGKDPTGPGLTMRLQFRGGWRDETRVYNGLLSADQVTQEYAMQNATGYSAFGEVRPAYFPPVSKALAWNGEEQIGIHESGYYTIVGGTSRATEVNSYSATVRLNEPGMKWSDTGTSEDRTVGWSIVKAENAWLEDARLSISYYARTAPALLVPPVPKFGTLKAYVDNVEWPEGATSTAAPTHVGTGTHKLVYKVAASDNWSNAIETSLEFTIVDDSKAWINRMNYAGASEVKWMGNEFLLVFTNTEALARVRLDGRARGQLLVVGGGGAGGPMIGGGGGGGGVIYHDDITLAPGVYSIKVGKGGKGLATRPSEDANGWYGAGANGDDSYFSSAIDTYVAYGGGGGGGASSRPSNQWRDSGAGGSSGGGTQGRNAAKAKDLAQGNNGGNGSAGNYAGGGGGAAGAGTNGSAEAAGDGGAGRLISIDGKNVYYGAGGGASRVGGNNGTVKTAASGGEGGQGGGGAGATKYASGGSTDTDAYGKPGTSWGAGGGGSGVDDNPGSLNYVKNGVGYQGIVILRIKSIVDDDRVPAWKDKIELSINGRLSYLKDGDALLCFEETAFGDASLTFDDDALVREVLLVGGGGGGGNTFGGGGGGGGFLSRRDFTVPAGHYTVTVGKGGSSAGGNGGQTALIPKNGGGPFEGLIAPGGGGGAAGNGDNVGKAGGSGGGGGGNVNTAAAKLGGAALDPDLGNSGGSGYYNGGGGGGASAIGGNGSTGNWSSGGTGGAGKLSSISGKIVTYAGGGGGGSVNNSSGGGGGAGGGGRGGNPNAAGTNGTDGLGGGGGGGGNGRVGGTGGSGVVYLKVSSVGGIDPKKPAWSSLVDIENALDIRYVKNGEKQEMIVRFVDTAKDAKLSLRGSAELECLVVGGGGAGGAPRGTKAGGGGGAGGFLEKKDSFKLNNPYGALDFDITVGAGGVSGMVQNDMSGAQGKDSVLVGGGVEYRGLGGGAGGYYWHGGSPQGWGGAGGSGGGATHLQAPGNATQPFSSFGGFGNAGGVCVNTEIGSGGGGATVSGHGQISGDVTGVEGYVLPSSKICIGAAGSGGDGRISVITGDAVYYAGGGGGGGTISGDNVYAGGLGGIGGGGRGGCSVDNNDSACAATAGANYTGSGGGGGCNTSGGRGGSGIVIVRVKNVTPLDIPNPGPVEGLVYDGTEQFGVVEHPKFYTIEGGSGTTVGTYRATLTLVNDINRWANVSSAERRSVHVEWTISKAPNAVDTPYSMTWREGMTPGEPAADATFGTPRFVWAAAEGDERDLEWHDWDATKEDGRPSEAGEYWLKAIVDEGDNWYGAESEWGRIVIEPSEVPLFNSLAYESTLSVDGYTGTETLDGFVLLVRIAEDEPKGFHYRDTAANGADIRFSDGNGHTYPCEIDSWDDFGTSYVWVRLPTMEASQKLTMHWGRVEGEKLPSNDPAKVWQGYAGVWHFDELTGAVSDATGFGRTAEPDSPGMTATEGWFGRGRVNGLADAPEGNRFNVTEGASLDLGDTFTFTGYFRDEDFGTVGTPVLISRKDFAGDGWEIGLDRAAKEVVVSGAGSTSVKAPFDLSAAPPQPVAKAPLKSSARLALNAAPLLGATASQDGDIEMGMDGLPYGFTRLEWIQSTREQVIVTDYLPNPKTVLKLELKMSGDFKNSNNTGTFPATPIPGSSETFTDTASIFGCNDTTVAAYSMNFGGNQDQNNVVYPWTVIGYQNNQGEPSHGTNIGSVHLSRNKMTVNSTAGTKKLTWGSSNVDLNAKTTTHKTHPLALFGTCGYDQYCQARPFGCYEMTLYSAQILEDGELKADFIPCRSESGEVGLYDRVGGKFYGNYLSEPDALFDGAKGIAWAESKFVAGPEIVELDYVQSTGYEYVDLGIKPGKDTRVVISYSPCGQNMARFFGYGGDGNGPSFVLTRAADGLKIKQDDDYRNEVLFSAKGVTEDVEYTLDVSNAKWILNGETLAENKGSLTKTCAGNAYLFAMQQGWATVGVSGTAGSWAQIRLMRLKFYEGEKLTHDFKPVKYVDGGTEKVGLWDTVDLKLLTSATAQPLQAGPERIFTTPDKLLDRATVVLDASGFEYDRRSHEPRITVATNGVTVVEKLTAAEINAGIYGFTAAWSPEGTTLPGTYNLILTGDNERFYGTNSKKSFEIRIDSSRLLANATVTLEKPSSNYDGLEHDPRITVATGGVAVVSALTAAEINARDLGFTASWSPSVIREPGAYTLTLVGDGEKLVGESVPVRFLIASYHRLDVTFDASAGDGKAAVTIYVDGEQKDSGQITMTGVGSALAFGGRSGAVSFGGDFDEFRLRPGLLDATQYALDIQQSRPASAGGEPIYAAGEAVRKVEDRTLANRWLVAPTISKTQWNEGEAPATTNACLAAHGEVKVSYLDGASGKAVPEMPTAVGVWTIVFRAEAEGYAPLEARCQFRITKPSHSYSVLGDGRTLLFNDDPTAAAPMAGQGYDCTNSEAAAYWEHSAEELAGDFNFLPGTQHTYYGKDGRLLWSLDYVRIGNNYPASDNEGEQGLERYRDRLFLPWNPDSAPMTGAIAGETVGKHRRLAGQAALQNTVAAMITSGEFTNGVGQVYFDAVNAFSDFSQTNGLEVAVEVSKRLSEAELHEKDIPYDSDEAWGEWKSVPLSAIRIEGEKMTKLPPDASQRIELLDQKGGALYPPLEPGVITWLAAPQTGVAAIDVRNEGKTIFAYSCNDSPTVNGVAFENKLIGNGTTDFGGFSFDKAFLGNGSNDARNGNYQDEGAGEYGKLLKNGIFDDKSGFEKTVTLNNLTVGNTYLVQVLVHDGRADYNCCDRQVKVDNEAYLRFGNNNGNHNVDGNRYGASFVGVFVAADVKESFKMTYKDAANEGHIQLNFIQLRDITDSPLGVANDNSYAVDYVESAGSTWLNTGVIPDAAGQIELGFTMIAKDGNAAIACARNTTSADCFTLFSLTQNTTIGGEVVRYDYNNVQKETSFDFPVNTPFDITMKPGKAIFIADGVMTEFPAGTDSSGFTVGGPLMLFASYTMNAGIPNGNLGNYAKARISYCRIYDRNHVLVLDLVPWSRNGTACFFDRVSRRFLYPGSGTLAAGPKAAEQPGLVERLYGGTYKNFFRLVADVNESAACRVRIRRASECADLGIDESLIMIDNLIASDPANGVELTTPGHFDPERTGAARLGYENAFTVPYPGAKSVVTYGRAQPVFRGAGSAENVQAAVMHYRWHYLNQMAGDWQSVYLDPKGGFVSGEPLKLPGYEGDLEYWYELYQDAEGYSYVDYSGTGLGLGGFGGGVANVTTNGYGEGWYVRLRAGDSEYQELRLVVNNKLNDTPHAYPMRLTADHVWQAQVPVADLVLDHTVIDPEEGGIFHYRVEFCNHQTPFTTGWAVNTNWYCQADDVSALPITSLLRAATDQEWSSVALDGMTDHILFQVDELSKAVSVVRANYQNFNLWTDARNDEKFQISAKENDSKTGVSPYSRVYTCDFSVFEPTQSDRHLAKSENTYWKEPFDLIHPSGGYPETYETAFTTPNGWKSGMGRYAYGQYRDPSKKAALEMYGQGAGSLTYDNSQVVNPRGLEKVTFNARLAQAIDFREVCYYHCNFKDMTNYTFTAFTAFDRKGSTSFSGNGSVSLFTLYQPTEGAYELRYEQTKANEMRFSLYRWGKSELKNGRPYGAITPVLMATGNSNTPYYEKTWGDIKRDKSIWGFNAPYTYESPAAEYQPLLMSVSAEKNRTTIRIGVRGMGYKLSDSDEKVYFTNIGATSNSQVEWWFFECVDETPFRMTRGSYGVLSANCPGVFAKMRFGSFFTNFKKNWGSLPYLSNVLEDSMKPYFATELHHCNTFDERWQAAVPGRMMPVDRSDLDSEYPYQFEADPTTQDLYLYVRDRGSMDWGEPVATYTISGFGGSGKNYEFSTAFNKPQDQDFRLAIGGTEWDRPINVAVDDVTLTQWRGVDFDTRYETGQLAWETKTAGLIDENDVTNNFVFSSVWFTGKAAKLSAKRTLPDRPSGIRTPLLDGAADRGEGFGLLALDYENAQPNVKLLVQIATNESIVASNAVANLAELDVLEDPRWLTVTNFDFSAGALATKRDSGTLVYNPGLHGVRGVMRVILDPSIYPEAQATPNPAAFGEIDILKAYVIDEPELDGKCWWGWNLQTTGLEERSLLTDWNESGLGGLALGLNNSVTEDLAETDWKLTPMYADKMPLVESPSVGTNEIASITFKARKYVTDPEGREGAAQVTVFGHDRKTGEWNVMEEVLVESPVFETYTVPGDRSIDAVRLAVTGVKGVKNPGRRPLSGADPVRVLIDEIAVSEGMTPKLAFRNVAAFRTNLRNLLPVENVMDKSEQPLTGEPWGVQCELYATALADEVDYTKPIKVRLYAYRGKEPWGYENWWTNETLNVIRTELQRAEGFSTSNMIFRSSFLNGSVGIMEPEMEDGTVVQYVLEASYYRLGNDRVITEMLGPGNWTTPKWYQPLDFNREYGSFSAYTIIDTVSPGWAWINEVNVFGPSPTHNPDEMYDNFADICQYIEIAAPMEADLTGWKLNVISYERREPCANTLATFGYGGLAGTKPGLKGSAANMVFRVIANPKAMYDPMFDTSKGTLDAYWKLTKAMDRDLCYENDGNFDPLVATVIELVRPSGIVESAVASIGKEFFMIIGGGGVTPQEEIATKVKKYYGLETVTPSPADTNYYQYAQGVEASVGVMLHNGEYVTDWFSDMKKTPGTLNERLDENGETVKQYIDPNHPMPNPDSIIVYAYVDETIGSLRQSMSETEAPTNLNRVVYLSLTNDSEVAGGYDIFHGLDIVYEVDPWYEMGEGSVEVTETNATYYATVTPVEGRERTYRVNVAKGSSNNVVVVARPRLNEKLREYGLTEDNRYTPAVLDWLRRHKRYAPDGSEIEFGNDSEELYLADYVPWGAPDKVCGQLTLTQMYWLDIDPTVSGQVFRAGFSSAPAPDWRETVRVSSNKYGEVWTEYVTNHFQTMGVSMMISNRYDATQAPYAPYVIRGVEAGSNTLGYESGPDKESWYDTTFSILGRLNIFDPNTQENWKPMRWFVFKPGSFGADFETKIEILDLYEPGSIAQAHWSEYLRDEEKKYGLFFQWHIGDDKNLPFEVEELKPENEFKW